jgi:hypothetical protein
MSFFPGISFKKMYEKASLETIHKNDNKIVVTIHNSFIKNSEII